jgi:hypothetical protein
MIKDKGDKQLRQRVGNSNPSQSGKAATNSSIVRINTYSLPNCEQSDSLIFCCTGLNPCVSCDAPRQSLCELVGV